MAKLGYTNIANLSNEQSVIATLAANYAAIAAAFELTLSRDGTSPNKMTADLDMDSNSILNLPEPVDPTEPARLQELEDLRTELQASSLAASVAAAAASATSAAASLAAIGTSVAAAATSATAAAASQSAAATSATAAATSATSAATSATTATTQASAASTSATSAASSATTATTQATNAAASASTASTQATNAAASASTASTQATNAAASATSAASSATSASSSASTATTQASNASTSATNAATSATSASSSATSATSSATSASSSATSASSSASTATTQASNASTSATNAASSASAASTSASSASTSATSASSSASSASTSATNAATSEANALAYSARYKGTSTTSLAIAIASKTFTTQASKNFDVGVQVLATSDADPTNYMQGNVTAYSGTTLTVNVTNIGGSGTKADWTITVSGTRGATGASGSLDFTAVVADTIVSGDYLLFGDVSNSEESNKATLQSAVDVSILANGSTFPNTGLKVQDTDASHVLSIVPGSNLTANRVLTVTTGDAARTLDISAGSVTISAAGAALIDDANAAAQLVTLGAAASGANTDITSIYLNNTGLKVKDTNASHGLSIVPGSDLTADRVLTITTGDAARTLDISAGSVTITAAGAALIDDAAASNQRTTLGLGTSAIIDTGTSGTKVALTDGANSWSAAQTIINSSGLKIQDTDASHTLGIIEGSNLTADRTLTITPGDASRTLTISGNSTISQDYSTTGNPQFATIELGAASDTTISRSGAGDIAVEGNALYRAGGTDVPVADGGTGLSATTAYAVLCGGTTSTAALQSIAGVGTSGQILTSNGAGALPTFQTAAGGGDLVKLTSGTVSAAATLDIVLTSYTSYRGLLIVLSNFIPATDNKFLWMRFSTNGGSTYDAGASDYKYYGGQHNGNATDTTTGIVAFSGVTTKIEIGAQGGTNATNGVGNGAAEGATYQISIMQQTSTAIKTRVNIFGGHYNTDDKLSSIFLAGMRDTAQDTDAVRFLFDSGNITSGNYVVYGYN